MTVLQIRGLLQADVWSVGRKAWFSGRIDYADSERIHTTIRQGNTYTLKGKMGYLSIYSHLASFRLTWFRRFWLCVIPRHWGRKRNLASIQLCSTHTAIVLLDIKCQSSFETLYGPWFRSYRREVDPFKIVLKFVRENTQFKHLDRWTITFWTTRKCTTKQKECSHSFLIPHFWTKYWLKTDPYYTTIQRTC